MQTTGSAAGVPEAVPVAGIYSLGDSITAGAQLADPSQAYPFLLAAHYDRPVHNLAAGGATAVATAKDQLPLVSEPCWLGTLNVGTNDAAFMVLGSETLAQFAENLQTIVHTLQRKCTRVVVMTAIENANSQTERFGPQDAVERAAVNADILALSGVTVLDLNRDARLHDPAYFVQPRNLHPDQAGQTAIAEDIQALDRDR
jgi:lysophospholipase L1-like esterase